MKLFASKDNCLFLRLSLNQNWSELIKFKISKTIWFRTKRAYVFLKVIIWNIYIKNYKAKVDHVFKLELSKVKQGHII